MSMSLSPSSCSLFQPKYAALTKNKTFANVLAGKLQENKIKHPNFEFEITTTTVTKVVTNVKYEKMD